MEDTKKLIAENMVAYRKQARLTQAELADKLSYSDKAVSKWERGESVPDVLILKQLADLYGIRLDDFFSTKPKKKIGRNKRKHIIIPLLSAAGVWALATLVYVMLYITLPEFTSAWLGFIYAIPVSAVVLLIFNCIWGKRIITGILISIIVWTTILSIFLSLSFVTNIWILFLLGVPLQILIILWDIMKARVKA